MIPARLKKFDPKKIGHVALKGFFGITKDWSLNVEDQINLLGDVSRAQLFKFKKLPYYEISKDCLERIQLIFGIFENLNVIFQDEDQAKSWLFGENTDFNKETPIKVMLGGSILNLIEVKRYLDAWRYHA